MNDPVQTIRIIAANELSDSVRSRRVIVLLLFYLIGAMAGTILFIKFLGAIEGQMSQTLGLAAAKNNTGGVTATLWKSAAFREVIIAWAGDRTLAETMLAVPPLALFYGWLCFTFGPMLVMLTAAPRISEEIAAGSVRFVMFRADRMQWCLGKFAGLAVQLFGAFLLSAVGAWVIGLLRMDAFEAGATAGYMLLFALKAWLAALPFLGLALAISQLCAAPNLALAFGLGSLVGFSALGRLSAWLAGDGWRRIWDVVNVLLPAVHRKGLWWNDAAHLVPSAVFLLTLTAVYLLAGYARFSRRDL